MTMTITQAKQSTRRHQTRTAVIAALALSTAIANPAIACDKGAVTTVEKIYKVYVDDGIVNQMASEIYSPRLQPIVKKWNTRCEANIELEGCILDGDFFIDGNDYKISKLKVSCLSGDSSRSRVLVKFRNFDVPSTKVFDMVKDGDRWFIDAIADGIDGKDFLGEIFKVP